MSEVLLEQYIRNQIFVLEKNSCYDNDLLEESKIIDALKSLIPRSKIEAAAGLGILGLIFSVAANTENLSDNSSDAFDQVEDQIVDAGADTSNRKYQNAEDKINSIMQQNKLTFAELVDKYRISDPSLMAELEAANNDSSEEPSQSQLDEMFFNYMDGLYKDYQLSDFNDMSKEDFDYTVNQFEKFLDRFAFKLNKKEFNQAMSLAFTLSASEHYNQSSNQIKQSRQRLESVQSTLRSIDNLSGGLPEPENYAEGVTQEDVERQMSEMINSQIDDLRKMRDELEEKYNNPDNEAFYDDGNEEKLSMYDDMIKRIKERFRKRFGFKLMKRA